MSCYTKAKHKKNNSPVLYRFLLKLNVFFLLFGVGANTYISDAGQRTINIFHFSIHSKFV